MSGCRLCAQIRGDRRSVGNARSSNRIAGVERPTYFVRGLACSLVVSGQAMFWCTARFRIRARSQGVSCAELARADPADKASGPAAWLAPGRITHERTCRCQRLLVGRRAHLMEPGAMMTRAPVMLAADVAAIGRQEATQDAQHPTAIPKQIV